MSKVAIVTGGAKGIGAEVVRKLSEDGYDVAIVFRGSDVMASELVLELQNLSLRASAYKCDVSKEEEVKATIDKISEEMGEIEVLVNNAGITKDNLLIRMKEEEFDDVIDVNLKGTYNFMRYVSPLMMRRRAGRIINITSVVGICGNVGQANYSASKAGVIGLTKSAAKELAPRGITVNAVAPGFITTDMTDALSDKIKDMMLDNIPLRRYGEVKDVANLVSFLASESASYITGEVIRVDGGMFI